MIKIKVIGYCFFLVIATVGILWPPTVWTASPSGNGPKRDLPDEPRLVVEPTFLDFGVIPQGQRVSRRIEITNGGRQLLRWQGRVVNAQNGAEASGRYVGFQNPEVRGTGIYSVLACYKNWLEFAGAWSELHGYPTGGAKSMLRFHITGAGLRLYYWKDTDGGTFTVYVNGRSVAEVDTRGEKRERAVFTAVENMPQGPLNILVLVNSEIVSFDGIQILGREAVRGTRGFITILPDGGVTTREIDYVNVTVDTRNMAPAVYQGLIEFESNGGKQSIYLYVEVAPVRAFPRWIDVFRYTNGRDYLYTANPQGDEGRIMAGNYRKEGIAFRLFPPAAQGTQEFFRWYLQQKGIHFYTYDKAEAAKSVPGSLFDGSIGNIATTRLPQTRALYRWRHERSGHYFYTTDASVGEVEKKGYKFEGIAGYVH